MYLAAPAENVAKLKGSVHYSVVPFCSFLTGITGAARIHVRIPCSLYTQCNAVTPVCL
ncbi:hypothetical protein OK016_04225 [Vibrio chagasii]|nr:hypothetical protein [Vibrio chagasii]